MNTDIKNAFDALFCKAVASGEHKVGNPKYRQFVNEKGHKVYILVNKDEHPDASPKVNEETFNQLHGANMVSRHFDEPPIVRNINDLTHLDFLGEKSKQTILRAFNNIRFYEQGYKVAKARGKSGVAEGFQNQITKQYQIIDAKVLSSFNNQNSNEFGEETFEALNELSQHAVGCKFIFTQMNNSNGFSQDICEYMNSNYPNFDVVELTKGMMTSINKQRQKLEKQGIPVSQWHPTISLNFTSRGFEVGCVNNKAVVEDKYGFSNDLSMRMSRSFSSNGDEKSVSHSIFVCGNGNTGKNETNPLRQGFAKDIMQNFYKQYKNCNLNTISVHAASEGMGKPYCGSNTWGRWGFQISKSSAERLLASYREQFQQPKECLVDEIVVYHNDENIVTIKQKQLDGTYTDVIVQQGQSTNANGRIEKITLKTKESNDDSGFKYKTKVLRSVTIKPDDIDAMQKVFNKSMFDKQPNEKFRLRDWYEYLNNDVVKAVMAKTGWVGSVDLHDENQMKDFESNLFKQY